MINHHKIALETGLRMSICGLICYVVYQYFHLPEGFWAVVTIAAITRPNLSGTYLKALLRLGGTLLGAFIGWIAAIWIGDSSLMLFALILIFTWFTTYIGLQTKPYDYFSTVAGFSAVIVIEGYLLQNLNNIAFYRTTQVCFAILVMAIISSLMALYFTDQDVFYEKNAAKKIRQAFQSIVYSQASLIRALIISLTSSLTFLSWIILRYPQGSWITITVIIIMEDSLSATNEKAWARLLGQILAAILGGVVAIFFPGNHLIIGLVLGIGFFICGVMIGEQSMIPAMGSPAGIALAVMLLSSSPEDMLTVVIERFLNVMVGIIIASLVCYWLQSSRFKK